LSRALYSRRSAYTADRIRDRNHAAPVHLLSADLGLCVAAVAQPKGLPGLSGPPAWSPDRAELAVETTSGIYVINKNGAALHLVSRRPMPTWYGRYPDARRGDRSNSATLDSRAMPEHSPGRGGQTSPGSIARRAPGRHEADRDRLRPTGGLFSPCGDYSV